LIAASAREQEKLAEVASGFSEDDLTRYLQLTLDLFKDLQFSLQPRLQLEVGLLRLVHAGKLVSIEEALSDLGGGSSTPVSTRKPPTAPPTPPPTAKSQLPTPASAPVPASAPTAPTGPWRDRLHTALLELGMQFTADAVEHSQVTESNGELQFVTPEEFSLAMNEKDILKVVQKITGRPMRIKIALGKPDAVAVPGLLQRDKPKDDVSERALAHPEVRRFQELFPDAQVRVVRNLKE
jgi:DNA polymerase-3 subunit gamma/tau